MKALSMKAPRTVRAPERGFTLVELMVSMVLLATVVAMTFRVAATVIAGFRSQRQVVAIERSARASLDLMADAIRAVSPGVPKADLRDFVGCTTVLSNIVQAISVTNSATGPDTITMIYAKGGVVTLSRRPVGALSTDIEVIDGTGIARGDSVIVTDGNSGRLIKITDAGTVQADGDTSFPIAISGAAACTGGMPNYNSGALVIRGAVSRFSVVVDADGIPLLMMDPDGDGPEFSQPIADGVEDMQVAIGVDVNQNGTLLDDGSNTDEWFGNNVADVLPPLITGGLWRAIRITFVAKDLADTDAVNGGQLPAVEDRPAGPVDGVRRRVLTTQIELRNFGGG
jgi:prepilin-type N-terminal cleavage/methylation domain-containing protein